MGFVLAFVLPILLFGPLFAIGYHWYRRPDKVREVARFFHTDRYSDFVSETLPWAFMAAAVVFAALLIVQLMRSR